MNKYLLKLDGFSVSLGSHETLKSITFEVGYKEIHAIMGPNGAGKSTLALALAGLISDDFIKGKASFDGIALNQLDVTKRARRGLFVTRQNPPEVPGVTIEECLGFARGDDCDPTPVKEAFEIAKRLDRIDLITRNLNENLSGGEKKYSEVIQALAIKPKLLILDEIDSGLDVDGIKTIINSLIELNTSWGTALLFISHYPKILKQINPDKVHILIDGRIIKTGGLELLEEIETSGFEKLLTS